MITALSYDDFGSGLPVVLIHGFPLNRKMWQPQIESLAAAGFRAICPDLPGFGESPLDGTPSMDSYADRVIALLDQLGCEKAVVGGMSMGGYVLLNLAERYPDRLLGAMYIVTRAAADDVAGKEKRTMLAGEVLSGNRQIIPDTFAKVLFAPQTPAERPELVNDVRRWMESNSAEGIAGGLLAMRDRDDFVDKLPGLKIPALVIGAEQDVAVPLAHAQALAQGLPNAHLEIIPAAGHMVNLEQTEKFNQALLRFLSSIA